MTKDLEFVQSIITRMASNSFLLKGWSITVTTAFLALSAKDPNPFFAIIPLFPAIAFWGLDAYYLRQERLYRKLYNDLRLGEEEENKPVQRITLSTTQYVEMVPSWIRTLVAPVVIAVHGSVLAIWLARSIFLWTC